MCEPEVVADDDSLKHARRLKPPLAKAVVAADALRSLDAAIVTAAICTPMEDRSDHGSVAGQDSK